MYVYVYVWYILYVCMHEVYAWGVCMYVCIIGCLHSIMLCTLHAVYSAPSYRIIICLLAPFKLSTFKTTLKLKMTWTASSSCWIALLVRRKERLRPPTYLRTPGEQEYMHSHTCTYHTCIPTVDIFIYPIYIILSVHTYMVLICNRYPGAPEQVIVVERLQMPPPEERRRVAQLLDVLEVLPTAYIYTYIHMCVYVKKRTLFKTDTINTCRYWTLHEHIMNMHLYTYIHVRTSQFIHTYIHTYESI